MDFIRGFFQRYRGKQVIAIFLIFSLFFTQSSSLVYAASSPWAQTDWSGGSGQTSFSDTTKFDSSSNVTTSTAGQTTLTNTEKLTNTGFETNLTGWTANTTSFSDSSFAASSGAVASWPLDDTVTTQSYARVINPAVATGRDIVINGDFATDTIWTKGTGWTISGGVAVASAAPSGGTGNLSQAIPIVVGKAYQITYTISGYSAGTIRVLAGNGGIGTSRSADGTYTETIVGSGTANLFFQVTVAFTGNIDNVTVTQLNIPAYNATPTQLLTDGDMEDADGSPTSSWTVGGGATLSKQTSNPHSGSQLLREVTSGSSVPQANQTILTVGNVYRAYGYARSDGNMTPKLWLVGAISLWTGTTSTSWQPFDVVFVAQGTTFSPGTTAAGTTGQYVEWDDVVVSLDTGIRQGELIQDGDMETSGTSYWAALNSATLSKQTISPHGGTQVLRVLSTGLANPAASQNVLAVGKTYRVTGFARSDGTATPRVRDEGTSLFPFTTSTSWQAFDVTYVTDNVRIRFDTASAVNGQYVEFDDVSITEVDPLVGKPLLGVTLGATTGSGGHLTNAYSFDGLNDVVNIYSSDLNSAFNQSEGTMLAWAKVSGAGVWTNGAIGRIASIGVDSGNRILLNKPTGNNTIDVFYNAGGTTKTISKTSFSSTGWFNIAITWSKSNDQVKMYVNGIQEGSTLTGLGTWIGNLSTTVAVIGASDTSGVVSPWSGLINDVRLYNTPLSATQIAALYAGVNAVRDTSIKLTGTASAKVVSPEGNGTFVQSVNVGDTNSYNLVANAYTDGSAVTSSDAQLWYNGAVVATTYTSVGGGWYKLTGTITGVASSVEAGVQVQAGKTVYLDDMSLNSYTTSGTLTSSIFDSGQGSNWGALTYTATIPTNTTVTVKARTSNDSGMSGATAFATCNAITSGADISSNNCVTDTHRYIQYQFNLANSSTEVTPTFQDITTIFVEAVVPAIVLTPLSPDPNSDNTPTLTGTATDADATVASVQFQMDSTSGSWSSCTASDSNFNTASEEFSCTATTLADGSHTMYVRATDSNGNTTVSGSYAADTFTIDATAPASIELDSPANNSYTNSDRPTFKWKATTDATSGLSKYIFEIDNPSLGSNEPSGDFTIDSIPTSGTADVTNNKYVIHFENFSDSDATNNYISVYAKSSSDWSSSENDGKLREGRVSWKVKAVDNAGNETSSSRTLFVDRTNPILSNVALDVSGIQNGYQIANTLSPAIAGILSDNMFPDHIVASFYKQTLLFGVVGDQSLYSQQTYSLTPDGKLSVPFSFTPTQHLDYGNYELVLQGFDKAGNATDEKKYLIVVLNPPASPPISTDQTNAVTPEETPPAISLPGLEKKAEVGKEQVSTELHKFIADGQNTLINIADWITRTFQTTKLAVTNTINSTVSKILIALEQLGKQGSDNIASVTKSTEEGLSSLFGTVFDTGENILSFVLYNIVNTTGNVFAVITDSYHAIAQALPGFIGNGLAVIGNGIAFGTNTLSEVMNNASNMLADSQTVQQKAVVQIREELVHDSGVLIAGVNTVLNSANNTLLALNNIFEGSVRNVRYAMVNTNNERVRTFAQIPEGLALFLRSTEQPAQNSIGFLYRVRVGVDMFYAVVFDKNPTKISKVRVEEIGKNYVVVSWRTNHYATGKVNYGKDLMYGKEVFLDNQEKYHKARLTGLKPGQRYYFEVMSQGKNYVYDAYYSFTTKK